MKSQRSTTKYLRLAVFVLCVSLAGCGDSNTETLPPPSTSASPVPTVEPSSLPPTATARVTQTPELLTSTMAPTLTADQEEDFVLDLLQSNAGCQLPCWWGFTPGETTWQTAQTYFDSLGKKTDEFSNARVTNYTVKFSLPRHDIQIGQVYNVSNGTIGMIWVKGATVRNNERVFGDQLFLQDWQHYMPSQMLSVYGQPAKVLLKTFQSVPDWVPPFNMLLYYPQQGILVRYYGPTERRGEQIRLCPQQADVTLWLWSPELTMTLEDIARLGQDFPIEEVADYRSLEAVTEMDVETFHETFKDAGMETCIETSAKLWP